MTLIRPVQKPPRIDVADFEEMLLNKPEHEKWELIDGRVIKSMVGARWSHHRLVSNIERAIGNHLDATRANCFTFRETFFLKRKTQDLSALPDVMVRCGPLEPDAVSVDDPKIIFEVLSPGTETNDRLVKRLAYQQIPSLEAYILVERDKVLLDVYRRREDGWHGEPPLDSLSDTLQLPEIEFAIPLSEIYRGVADDGAI